MQSDTIRDRIILYILVSNGLIFFLQMIQNVIYTRDVLQLYTYIQYIIPFG